MAFGNVNEDGTEQAMNPARYQTNVPRLEQPDQLAIVVLTAGKSRLVLVIENDRLDASLSRSLEPGSIRPVRNHDGQLSIELPGLDGVDDRLEVAAPTRDQDTNAPTNGVRPYFFVLRKRHRCCH